MWTRGVIEKALEGVESTWPRSFESVLFPVRFSPHSSHVSFIACASCSPITFAPHPQATSAHLSKWYLSLPLLYGCLENCRLRHEDSQQIASEIAVGGDEEAIVPGGVKGSDGAVTQSDRTRGGKSDRRSRRGRDKIWPLATASATASANASAKPKMRTRGGKRRGRKANAVSPVAPDGTHNPPSATQKSRMTAKQRKSGSFVRQLILYSA